MNQPSQASKGLVNSRLYHRGSIEEIKLTGIPVLKTISIKFPPRRNNRRVNTLFTSVNKFPLI
jgi:hypothetical protein